MACESIADLTQQLMLRGKGVRDVNLHRILQNIIIDYLQHIVVVIVFTQYNVMKLCAILGLE